MYIGIYTEPYNTVNYKYRGIYRLNIPVEYWTNKKYGKLYNLANWYVENSVECNYFPYTQANYNKLVELYSLLSKYCECIDLLVFGTDIPKDVGNFLGYDVVGIEYDMSMIEEMIFDCKNSVLFHMIFEYFGSKLNQNGLFNLKEDAIKLIYLYDELKKYGVNLELICEPKPVEIYSHKGQN